MNSDIAIEFAETLDELNNKIVRRVKDDFELLGDTIEVHLEQIEKPTTRTDARGYYSLDQLAPDQS